jgi:cell fate (sporulation/competence/biofilm development) regulator YlbF (YheA/YmcA/DUF963 family)
MYNIVPPLLIVLGIVGLIFLLSNKEFKEKEQEIREKLKKDTHQRHFFLFIKWRQIFNKKNIDLLNCRLSNFFEKLLIRFRIIILRIDHLFLKELERLKKKKEMAKEIQNKSEAKENFFDFARSEKKGSGAKRTGSYFLTENGSSLKTEESNLSSIVDLEEEEKKFLTNFLKNPQEESSLINLARLYLFKKDFSSARWALLEAHRLKKEDNIIKDLLSELQEKEMPA